MGENKPQKTYFLFGSEITKAVDEGDLAQVVKSLKRNENVYNGDLFVWNPETSTPFDLMNAYDGWDGWTTINEQEYKKLSKYL